MTAQLLTSVEVSARGLDGVFQEHAPLSREALNHFALKLNEKTLHLVKIAHNGHSKGSVAEHAAVALVSLSPIATFFDIQLNTESEQVFPADVSLVEAAALAHLSSSRLVYAINCGVDGSDTAQDLCFKLVQIIRLTSQSVNDVILSLSYDKYPPRWVHDCEDCRSLGRFKEFDLYFCKHTGRWPELVARYGHGNLDYSVARLFDTALEHFNEAHSRAKLLGMM